MSCGPSASGTVGLNVQSPDGFTVVVPISTPLSFTCTMSPGTPLPAITGSLSSVVPWAGTGPTTGPTLSVTPLMLGAGELRVCHIMLALRQRPHKLKRPVTGSVDHRVTAPNAILVNVDCVASRASAADGGMVVVGRTVVRHSALNRAHRVLHVRDHRRVRARVNIEREVSRCRTDLASCRVHLRGGDVMCAISQLGRRLERPVARAVHCCSTDLNAVVLHVHDVACNTLAADYRIVVVGRAVLRHRTGDRAH